jgi:hypothetical protein
LFTFLFQDGDIVEDANTGAPIPIQGNHLVSQNVAWALLTEEDQERNIGCNLIVPSRIFAGGKTDSPGAKQIIGREISNAIDKLIENQEEEYAYSAPAERVAGISQINISGVDKTSFSFYVAVATQDQDIVPASYKILLGQQFATNADKHILSNIVTDDVR